MHEFDFELPRDFKLSGQLPDGIAGAGQMACLPLRACYSLAQLPESFAESAHITQLDLCDLGQGWVIWPDLM